MLSILVYKMTMETKILHKLCDMNHTKTTRGKLHKTFWIWHVSRPIKLFGMNKISKALLE